MEVRYSCCKRHCLLGAHYTKCQRETEEQQTQREARLQAGYQQEHQQRAESVFNKTIIQGCTLQQVRPKQTT